MHPNRQAQWGLRQTIQKVVNKYQESSLAVGWRDPAGKHVGHRSLDLKSIERLKLVCINTSLIRKKSTFQAIIAGGCQEE